MAGPLRRFRALSASLLADRRPRDHHEQQERYGRQETQKSSGRRLRSTLSKGSVAGQVFVLQDGVRSTHPIKNRIGKKFVGTIGPALHGHVITETIDGTIGRLVQVVVPVTGADGSVVGLVSAGIKVDKVSGVVDRQLPLLLGA